MDKARYATSVVDEFMDTAIVKIIKKFYKNTFPYDMIFTKDGVSTSES